MQIVRDLAGYTLGRSDLVRRAMSKKKAAVMEKERQNFVYGNAEEGVLGCVANGIDEKVANKIYDDMIDFAKYAFNKSHAAAYAVVSYQTAYLKYYYPVEYMAALMTSVMDNSTKVSEYILSCRQMGIRVLPPDINQGEGAFSVDNGNIRYGLSAIKSIGRPVIEAIIQERQKNGPFQSLKDFISRLSGKEVNKRTLENFIKSGAFDGLGGNRRQFIQIYATMIDQMNQERKNSLEGQMSLFDFVPEEEKKEYEITLPNVEEFPKEVKLAFEKEVMGVYITGHPLEEYEQKWRKNITAVTTDFMLDEESNTVKVQDGSQVVIGGMITAKTIKYTKQNQAMAFLTIEDLVGTVEVVIFPRDYQKNQAFLNEDEKVFILGHVNVEEDRNGKLICEKIMRFDDTQKELWLQFANKEVYEQQIQEVLERVKGSDGNDPIIVYLADQKVMKRFPPSRNIKVDNEIVNILTNLLGEKNVKVVEKDIAIGSKRY